MARGRAYSLDFRIAMMKQHAQGRSWSTLSRETDVPRDVLRRWWQRYAAGGEAALRPRSRRPRRSPRQVLPATESAILALRTQGLGPARIALQVAPSVSTVYRTLVRHGRNQLHPPIARTVQRYEKSRPGELVHVDLKYLPSLENRAEFEFAAVDDFTREAVVWIAGARTTHNATTFLEHLVDVLPYPIEAVMTDNDLVFTMRFAYYRQRRTRFEDACRRLGICHRRLRPHAPESNGKVERFIKSIDDECLAVYQPQTCAARTGVVREFVWYYNHQRPHLSLAGQTPIQRRHAYLAQLRLMS
jgi:transposase InsO family protein